MLAQAFEQHLLLPGELGAERQQKLRSIFETSPKSPDAVFLTSSGSSGELKLIELPHSAILCAAKAVSDHYEIRADDVWALSLPSEHIGGLSILARAEVSGCKLESFPRKWDAPSFTEQARAKSVTICSLVPTQLFDVVAAKIQAPDSLRLSLIGGEAASSELLRAAAELGWAPRRCYGMTETSAMFSDTESLEAHPVYKALPHVEIEVREGRLAIRSDALFRAYYFEDGLRVAAEDSFLSADLAELDTDSCFRLLGRADGLKKIRGMFVSEFEIEALLLSELNSQFRVAVFILPEQRAGGEVLIAVEAETEPPELEERCSALLPKYLRPFRIVKFSEFPKLFNGKVDRSALLKQLA